MATVEVTLTDLDIDRLAEKISKRLHPQREPKLLWSEKEAAKVLGVSVFFLKKLRQDGHITAHSAKRPILYTWAQIEAVSVWLAKRT